MNKIVWVLSISLLVACSSSKKAAQRPMPRDTMLGGWIITDIRFEGLAAGEKLAFDLMDEGSEQCLRGSEWSLPNNGNGKYVINSQAAGCATGERKIIWSHQQKGNEVWFQFKKAQDGVKPKNIEDGYKFRVLSYAKDYMLLESTIQYAGNPIQILYTFTKK